MLPRSSAENALQMSDIYFRMGLLKVLSHGTLLRELPSAQLARERFGI